MADRLLCFSMWWRFRCQLEMGHSGLHKCHYGEDQATWQSSAAGPAFFTALIGP